MAKIFQFDVGHTKKFNWLAVWFISLAVATLFFKQFSFSKSSLSPNFLPLKDLHWIKDGTGLSPSIFCHSQWRFYPICLSVVTPFTKSLYLLGSIILSNTFLWDARRHQSNNWYRASEWDDYAGHTVLYNTCHIHILTLPGHWLDGGKRCFWGGVKPPFAEEMRWDLWR